MTGALISQLRIRPLVRRAGGAAIFAAELECLCQLVGQVKGEWLEVGVATRHFAHGLGVRKRGSTPHLRCSNSCRPRY